MALDRLASVLAAATGAVRVEVWVRVGPRLRPQATWPHGSTPSAPVPLAGSAVLPAFDAATRAVAVRHGDELLGAITLQKPRNEPVSATEDKLLEHLASQAGLVLRNVRLTADFRPASTTCGHRGGGWCRLRTPSGSGSSGTCTTAPSSSSSRSTSSSPCWRTPPTSPVRSGRSPASSGPGCTRRSMTCAPWPAGSTRRCSPTRGSRGPAGAGGQGAASRPGRGGRHRALPAGGRGRRVLLHPGGPAERREVRGGLRATVTLSCRTATSGSPSPTTATASTPPRPRTAPACRAWPTGWPRSAAPSASTPRPVRHHHQRHAAVADLARPGGQR